MNNLPAFLRTLSAFATLALVFATASSLSSASLERLADKPAPALPVSTSFEKGPQPEKGGPYVLKIKNTSSASLTLHAVIRWSVISHGSAKTLELPAHTLAPAQVWAIDELAVEDHITLSAEGFASLELKVPPAKADQ